MTEIWKDIDGYECLYQISNFGRVKALDKTWVTGHGRVCYKAEHIIKCASTSEGYILANLWKNGKCKGKGVHVLVANAFIPNPEKKAEVNHKDNNPSNNTLSNLGRCTRLENQLHAVSQGRYRHKLTEDQVLYIRNNPLSNTQKELAKKFDVNQSTITKIINNKRRLHNYTIT